MKLSFDEAHRHAMCQLGGLHAVAELIEMDHAAHGSECDDQNCVTLRRYAGMALTNLTFGDGNNKALLCSFKEFMKALIAQLRSPSDDLRQVTASVLRNLSWRADSSSKQTLREVGAVIGLTKAAMEGRKESTLKSILSALWNLSAHCSTNKVDICAVDGALAFLVDMLSYKAPSKTLAIVENTGGILRNVSSHVAVREDYRMILRERGCLQVLLRHLRSPSLTVVSNACGALWNLSARCPQDQRLLWDLGAVPMLRSLVYSKHKMISMGSSAALKNLLEARPGGSNLVHLDSTARGLGLPSLPTLVARRQRALEQEIDENLAETCDNIEPSTSPINKDDKFMFKVDRSFVDLGSRTGQSYQTVNTQPGPSGTRYNGVARTESRESIRSVTSTHSDTIFERVNRHILNGISPADVQVRQQSSSLHSAVGFDARVSTDGITKGSHSEKKYVLQYKNAIPEGLKPSEIGIENIDNLRCTASTMSWSSAPNQESACSQVLLYSSIEDNLSETESSKLSMTKVDETKCSYYKETKRTSSVKPDNQKNSSTKSAVDSSTFTVTRVNNHSPFEEIVDYDNVCTEESLPRQRDLLNAVSSARDHDPDLAGDPFGNYAETDLDQLTNYSLRYAESNLEDEEQQNSDYFTSREEEFAHEDSIKTYCTEGTPYETPLNFSRATSASDLQNSSGVRNTLKITSNERKLNNVKEAQQIITNEIQKVVNSSESEAIHVNQPVLGASAATVTTDKPQNERLQYYEQNYAAKDNFQIVDNDEETLAYSRENHYAEQKSLMLSKSSSLGSLNGFEQRCVHNDRNTVIGDFSRRTSGILSPSELSDCVSQTVLGSPHPNGPVSNALGVTNLNSLITDDEPKIANDSKERNEGEIKLDKLRDVFASVRTACPPEVVDQISDGDDDDEDLLAACINIGMQNNRHTQSFRRSSFHKASRTTSNLARYQTSTALDQVETNGLVDPISDSLNFKIFNTKASIVVDSAQDSHGALNVSEKMNTSENNYNLTRENDGTFIEHYECNASMEQLNMQPNVNSISTLTTTEHFLQDATEYNIENIHKPSSNVSVEHKCIISTAKSSPYDSSILPGINDRHVDSLDVSVNSNVQKVSEETRRASYNLDTPTQFSIKDISRTSLNYLYIKDKKNDETLYSTCNNGEIEANEENNTSTKNTIDNFEDTMIMPSHRATTNFVNKSFNSMEQPNQTLLELFFQPEISTDKNIPLNECDTSVVFSSEDFNVTKNSFDTTELVDTIINGEQIISPDRKDGAEPEQEINKKSTNDITLSPTIDLMLATEQRTLASESLTKHTKEEVYRRQRDPDAMIASLDRLTATLVQQTEAMRERESSAMKQSVVSDTWNEDSPNDVSYPSISVSAPLIASFKSDVQEDQGAIMPELVEEDISEHVNMTNSRIIEHEAIKLAEAVNVEANKHIELDAISMTSIDLDAIKPPSTMGSLLSLTTSYIGPVDNNETFACRDRCHSTSLPPIRVKSQTVVEGSNGRKKSLPAGVVAKRALNHGQNYTGSLENLLNECSIATSSQLENVKPPSMMDELLDVADMENSMLSVASITSEIADIKDQDSQSLTNSDLVFDLLKPVANVLSITCMRYAESMQVSENNSLSEYLENINPPSLFNEVSEMDESTMEAATDTLCSDTLCMSNEMQTEEVHRLIIADRIEEMDNDTDDGATPIPTEYCVSSSAESTPKKRLNKNHLTPKQKRQFAKERYKTYTIAAEMVKKEEEERKKQEHMDGDIVQRTGGKCSPFSKLTPKQRRREDRARFQTQVLDNPFGDLSVEKNNELEREQVRSAEDPEKVDTRFLVKSGIPMFKRSPEYKTIRQRRLENKENKERYLTRTLNDSECILKEDICGSSTNVENRDGGYMDTMLNITPEEIQTMLEHNANIVLNTLNETNNHSESIVEDALLDYETLSLISNDSESERNLRMRLANGLPRELRNAEIRPFIPVQIPSSKIDERKQTPESETVEQEFTVEQQVSASRDLESESDEESNSAEKQPQIPKGPRIIKPGVVSRDASVDSNAADKLELESPKGIRGKRKALYSKQTTRKLTPQSSPSKQAHGTVTGTPIGRSNTSPIVRSTRATTLRQNNNSAGFVTQGPQKSNTSPKIVLPSTDVEKQSRNVALTKNRTSIPQKGFSFANAKYVKRHSIPLNCSSNTQKEMKKEAAIKPLERQGTFTKDEPEVENAPTVLPSTSPSKSKIAKPLKNSPSKVHPVIGKSKSFVKAYQVSHQLKSTKVTGTAEKSQYLKGTSSSGALKRPFVGLPGGTLQISPSSQSLQSNESGKIVKKVMTLGQRSNSNSSIVSSSSTGIQGRRLAKEATSKIASLWKRVEESKNKHVEKNDTRQWITPATDPSEINATVVANKPPTFRLIRSSTFEGVSKDIGNSTMLYKPKSKRQSKIVDIQTNRMKYRNSCDLSGVSVANVPCKIPVKYTESRSNRKDTVQIGDSSVALRKQQSTEQSTELEVGKRMSRLGSFIRVDSSKVEDTLQLQLNGSAVRTLASGTVPSFNYSPKEDSPPHSVKLRIDETEDKDGVSERQMEIITASTRVTTV